LAVPVTVDLGQRHHVIGEEGGVLGEGKACLLIIDTGEASAGENDVAPAVGKPWRRGLPMHKQAGFVSRIARIKNDSGRRKAARETMGVLLLPCSSNRDHS
jgi:hypothetical protein